MFPALVLFGMSLSVDPSLAAGPTLHVPAPVTSQVMQLATVARNLAPDNEGEAATSGEGGNVPSRAELFEERTRIAKIHRVLGLATWSSMTVTVVLGWLQYANLYGLFADRDSTRCVEGNAFFGLDACVRQPLPHLVSSLMTTALYSGTYGLALAMPDPARAAIGDSAYARRVRRHKRLRWVHLVGMIAQMGLGFLIANSEGLGLDRANDYNTLRALSSVHMLIGMATYATMTWAGVLFLRY